MSIKYFENVRLGTNFKLLFSFLTLTFKKMLLIFGIGSVSYLKVSMVISKARRLNQK